MKIYLNMAEGYSKKDKDEPLKEHPCIVIHDIKNKLFYFFNLTTADSYKGKIPVVTENGKPKKFIAERAKVKLEDKRKHYNLLVTFVAVVKEKNVNYEMHFCKKSLIFIRGTYNCYNRLELRFKLVETICNYKNSFCFYNGNTNVKKKDRENFVNVDEFNYLFFALNEWVEKRKK